MKKSVLMKALVGVTTVMMSAAVLGMLGCASKPAAERSLSRTDPKKQPEWVNKPPKTNAVFSFVGVSGFAATAQVGRTDSRQNGWDQLVQYYGTEVTTAGQKYLATSGLATEVINPQSIGEDLTKYFAANISQQLKDNDLYTKVYYNNTTGREEYEVYTLMQIDAKVVKQAIENYGKNKAADLQRQAAAEQDRAKRQQLEKAREFFGGSSLTSELGF